MRGRYPRGVASSAQGVLCVRRYVWCIVAVAFAVLPSVARAQYTVTFAARACSSYTDVTANLARNDLQERLRDLGADTLYHAGNAPAPAVEDRGQPRGRPLPGWSFTLGRGIKGTSVSGSWGALSNVTS